MMNAGDLLRRLAGPFREFGVVAGALYVVDRLLSTISVRLRLFAYDLVVQDVPATPLLPARFARYLSAREIPRGDPRLAVVQVPETVIRSRFEQDSRCLGIYSKDTLVGYIWLCPGAYEEDEVRCTYVVNPPDEAVFDYDLVVLPEHRMGLGFAAVWHCTYEYLRARGITRSFSRMTRFNVASRRAHARLGARRVGRVITLRLGRIEVLAATIEPYFCVSMNERDRLLLKLHPHRGEPLGRPR